jgi:hypothetical protein
LGLYHADWRVCHACRTFTNLPLPRLSFSSVPSTVTVMCLRKFIPAGPDG